MLLSLIIVFDLSVSKSEASTDQHSVLLPYLVLSDISAETRRKL